MELTTEQLHALFAMLASSALAALMFYSIGLRSGRSAGFVQGRETAALHWRKLLDSKREANHDLLEQLNKRTGELMALRENIQAEAADHAEVERGLLQRLATSAPLSDEDLAVLLAIVDKLELAAKTFAGLGAYDKARFALHLAAQAKNMAERIEHAQLNRRPQPDCELNRFDLALQETSA